MKQVGPFLTRAGGVAIGYGFLVTAICIAAIFISALLTEPTLDHPTGQAGLSAAHIALFVAAMVLLEIGHSEGDRVRKLPRLLSRLPRLLIGLSAMSGAYLWAAEESELHPTNVELVATLSAIWLAAGIVAVFVSLLVMVTRPRSPVE